MFDNRTVWLFLCPVSIVQEVAGGGAAAEDIISPGHPQPLPRALQSSKLPCPQSWVSTPWRTLHWQICKSNPTNQHCRNFSGIMKVTFFPAGLLLVSYFTTHYNLVWLHWIPNTIFIRYGRPCQKNRIWDISWFWFTFMLIPETRVTQVTCFERCSIWKS